MHKTCKCKCTYLFENMLNFLLIEVSIKAQSDGFRQD